MSYASFRSFSNYWWSIGIHFRRSGLVQSKGYRHMALSNISWNLPSPTYPSDVLIDFSFHCPLKIRSSGRNVAKNK